MHRFLAILLLLLLGPSNEAPPPLARVGIITDHDYTIEQLVRDIFIKGECQNVSNIQAVGNPLSVGHFSGGNAVFGYSEGVIISSGDIALAEGPNSSVEASATFGNNNSDPDISLFATNVTFDIAGIEFDFVPVGETVTFSYVFASEEYCEFVGSIFNDVFGFFVSGPGINGPFANNAINVAVLPGTNEYVSINSVNHDVNNASYVKNERQEDAQQCGISYDPSFSELIEYDGMTIPLQATIDVIPCETYHIRLLVADVGDDKLDSGVFLQMKSFDIGGDVTLRAEVPGRPEPIAVEGCRDGQFVFERPPSNIDDPLTVHYIISADSDAENGIDFEPIPDSIVIAAGETAAILPITLIEDLLTEGAETLRLELDLPCECLEPVSSILIIQDIDPVQTDLLEIDVCAGQSFTLGPPVHGGTPPFDFLWQDGSTDSTITTMVTQVTHFTVTVTDACGTTASGIVSALIQPVPEAVISGEVSVCTGESGFLDIALEGNPPWEVSYAIDGGAEKVLSGLTESPVMLPVTQPGLYELISFQDATCKGTVSGTGTVHADGVGLQVEITLPSCVNIADGSIDLEITEGNGPFQIEWDPVVNDERRPTGLLPAIYTVIVTGADGCRAVEEIDLRVDGSSCQQLKVFIPNAFSPNGDGINDELRIYPEQNSLIREVRSFHVFNRWGAILYVKNEFQPDSGLALWDGTFKGKVQNPGVYVWQMVVTLEDGSEDVLAGDVTLVR